MKSMLKIFAAAVIGAATLTACGGHYKRPESAAAVQPAYKVTDTTVGTGDVAVAGNLVTITYSGYLYDATRADNKGAKVDGPAAGASAPPFLLGSGRPIPNSTFLNGLDQAVAGMRVGGARTVVLPADLAYGAAVRLAVNGYPEIPASTPLVYDIVLVSVSVPPAPPVAALPPTTTAIQEVTIGTGAVATTGRTGVVRYTGWLFDGTRENRKGEQFDTNITTPVRDPLPVVIDGTGVIPGFNFGVKGMAVGGKRTVVIPASEAYGAAGQGSIPPNAALVFDIELISVQ